MCTNVVNARLNHKTALTLEVTATKPKESIRNKSGKDAIHSLQNNPSQPNGRLHSIYGSVSAGQEFWLFRVIFFLKVELSCD